MFGAGGATSSYHEVEETDVVLLWGSNARETHPIFFQHLLKGLSRGARLYTVDPRFTSSAKWADLWLGLDVGTDVVLAHAMGREIIAAGLHHAEFVANATSGFEAYRDYVEPFTLAFAEAETGVPAAAIAEVARAYATAPRAQLCWTLGITEHHNAVDNVLALINLAILTGHVGRWGAGVNPLRGQNNVQGGGDMGALPDRLPGFQHLELDRLRLQFETAWGVSLPAERGWHLSHMFAAMGRKELSAVYCIGENPAQSEADEHHATRLLQGLDTLIVQDMFLTKTARLADVVLPASAGWCESEGTFTSSERRVQRVRRAKPPPGEAKDDLDIIVALARTMGHELIPGCPNPSAEDVWNEVRRVSPVHQGMSYARLEAEHGLQWPCWDETHPGEPYLHARLWERPVNGPRAPFSCVPHTPPFERLEPDWPLRLTTGRRLSEFNTGVMSGVYQVPNRRGETLDLSPADAAHYGLVEGERVRVRSRRGAVEVPIHVDPGLRAGLCFMTFHFPDDVASNLLTVDAVDPKSGTAEFKAAAVRIERLDSPTDTMHAK